MTAPDTRTTAEVGSRVTIGHGQIQWKVTGFYHHDGRAMVHLVDTESGITGRAPADRLRVVEAWRTT